jgi:hypothetical protein
MKNLALLLLIVTGCTQHHIDPPPGYDVACDGKGHYCRVDNGLIEKLEGLCYTARGRRC